LLFWQSHRNYVESICQENPSDANQQWLTNVDVRIENIKNGKTHETIMKKTAFGDVLSKKGKK
jgi:hypothetical protein